MSYCTKEDAVPSTPFKRLHDPALRFGGLGLSRTARSSIDSYGGSCHGGSAVLRGPSRSTTAHLRQPRRRKGIIRRRETQHCGIQVSYPAPARLRPQSQSSNCSADQRQRKIVRHSYPGTSTCARTRLPGLRPPSTECTSDHGLQRLGIIRSKPDRGRGDTLHTFYWKTDKNSRACRPPSDASPLRRGFRSTTGAYAETSLVETAAAACPPPGAIAAQAVGQPWTLGPDARPASLAPQHLGCAACGWPCSIAIAKVFELR